MVPRIAITGFMCVGKTTVAQALGQLLGCKVVDLDAAILESEGRNAAEIIRIDGEDAFRETESRVLTDLLSDELGLVISLGGGTWIIERNRKVLEEHRYLTVWLDAPLDLCWKRIEGSAGQRPLASSYLAVQQLFEARRHVYESADIRVPVTEAETPDDTANRIAALVLRDGSNS
ncbi:MAG TPA: shikimate kinase [Pyrinomonadaceae bacterium]|nr:shikimate kinase [Pyrinomonadaceae bacterium]